MGPGSVSSQGDADVREATHIAREMIFTCGFSRGLGPVALMEPARLATPYSDDETAASTSQVGSAVARIALGEVDEVNPSGLQACTCLKSAAGPPHWCLSGGCRSRQ